MDKTKEKELRTLAAQIRLLTAKEIVKRGFGHLGGSLSVVDALAVLYGKQMKYDPKNPHDPDRDYLVMSKGHAGPAVYATLAIKGFFPLEELDTLNQPNTNLPSHCDRQKTVGIDVTTGSLGQGTSQACGIALGNKLDGRENYTYLFIGDGESNEGQVWEAAMFSAAQKLDHLIWFIDYNGKQLDGELKDIIDMDSFKDKFESFGFFALDVDGHDVVAIDEAIEQCKQQKGRPSCIVLHTVKGKGLKRLEDIVLNHHIAIDEEFGKDSVTVLEEALKQLEEA